MKSRTYGVSFVSHLLHCVPAIVASSTRRQTSFKSPGSLAECAAGFALILHGTTPDARNTRKRWLNDTERKTQLASSEQGLSRSWTTAGRRVGGMEICPWRLHSRVSMLGIYQQLRTLSDLLHFATSHQCFTVGYLLDRLNPDLRIDVYRCLFWLGI